MSYEIIFFGGGIGSINTLINILSSKIKRRLKIAVIDKNIKNIPGGVAYGKATSSMGFFNNPCRLAPQDFIKWTLKDENKIKLLKILESTKSLSNRDWIKKNKQNYLKAKKMSEVSETYYPRIFFNYWMEERLVKVLEKNKLIDLDFYEGNIASIKEEKKNFYLKAEMKLKKYAFNIHKKKLFNEIIFKRNKVNNFKMLTSKKIFLSLGLAPPKNIFTDKVKKNKFYISNFYDTGGTSNLLKIIEKKSLKNKRKIKIFFLGAKAGFLEPLIELKHLIKNKRLNLELISASRTSKTLNSAILSSDTNNYKLYYFKPNLISKINTAKKLYSYLYKEFSYVQKKGYLKYDAWTKILNKNVLFKIIKNFNKKEKTIYDREYHSKIRAITRFTFPETVNSKNYLEQKKTIKMIAGNFLKINSKSGNFDIIIKRLNGKLEKIKSDILINVLGPQSMQELSLSDPLIKSLKNMKCQFTQSGLVVGKNFNLINKKNIYVIGTYAEGFNPERKTIIKAVLNNSNKASADLIKNL